MKHGKKPGPQPPDLGRIQEAVPALLWLTASTHRPDFEFAVTMAWKGHDLPALGRLHEKGLIGDPVVASCRLCRAHAQVNDSLRLMEILGPAFDLARQGAGHAKQGRGNGAGLALIPESSNQSLLSTPGAAPL